MARRSKNDDDSSSSSAESSTSIAVSEEDASSSSSSSSASSESSSSSGTVASDASNHPAPSEEEEEEDNSEEELDSEEDASSSSSTSAASSHASSESSTTIPIDPSSHHEEDDDFSVDQRTANIPRASLRSTLHSKEDASSSGTSESETVITEVTGLPPASSMKHRMKEPSAKPRQPAAKKINLKQSKFASPPEENEDSTSKDATSSSESEASDPNEEDSSEGSSATSESETVQTSETTPSEPLKKPAPVAKSRVVRNEVDADNSSHQSGVATSDSDTVPSVHESENSSQSPVRTTEASEKDDASDSEKEEEENETSEEEEASSESEESSESSASEVSQAEEDDNATSESETVITELDQAEMVVASNTFTEPVESPKKTVTNSRENSVRALDRQPVSNVRIESVYPTEKQMSKPEKGPEHNGVPHSDRKTLSGMLEEKRDHETGAEVPVLVQSKSFGEDVSVMTDDSSMKHLEKLEIGGKSSDAVSCMNSIDESITPSEEDDNEEDQKTVESSISKPQTGRGIHMMFHDSKPSIYSEESSYQPNASSILNLDLEGNAVEVFNLSGTTEPTSAPAMDKSEEHNKAVELNEHTQEESKAHEATRNVTTKKSGLFGRFKRGLNLSGRSQKLQHEPVLNKLSNTPASAEKSFAASHSNAVGTESVLKQNQGVQGLPIIPDDISVSAESKVTVVHTTPINSQDHELFEASKVPLVEKSAKRKGLARAQSFDSSGDEGLHPHQKHSLFGFLRRPKFKRHSSFDEATPVESHIVNKTSETERNSENPSGDSQLGFRLVDDAVFQPSSNFGTEKESEVTQAPLGNNESSDAKSKEVFGNNWNDFIPVQSMDTGYNRSTSSTGDLFAAVIPDASQSNRQINNEPVAEKIDTVGGTSDNDVFLLNVSEDVGNDDDEEGEDEEEDKDEDSSSSSEAVEDDASFSVSDGESEGESECSHDSDADAEEESESEKSHEATENSDDESNNSEQSGSAEISDDDSDSEEQGSEELSEEENPVIVDFVDLSDMISVSSAVSKRLADGKQLKTREDQGRPLDGFELDGEPVNDVSDIELFTGFNFYADSNSIQNQDKDGDEDELTNSNEPESTEDSSDDPEEEEDSSGRDLSEHENDSFEGQSSSHNDSEAEGYEHLIVDGADGTVNDDFTENRDFVPSKAEKIEMDADDAEARTEKQPEYVSKDSDPFMGCADQNAESPTFPPVQEKDAYEVEEVLGSAAFSREESFTFQDLNSKNIDPGTNSINPVESYKKSKSVTVDKTPVEQENLDDSAVDLMEGYGSDGYADDITSAKVPFDENRNGSREHKGFNLFRLPIFTRKAKKSELEDRSSSERQMEPVFFAQTSPESHGIIDVELGNKVTYANSADYDVNMEHSSSLVSEDFRINEVPRRMSMGSTMSPRRTSTCSLPRKPSIGSPRKLSIPGTTRKLSMSSNNSSLSNWLMKPKESSSPFLSKSEDAEKPYSPKKFVNSVDLEDEPAAVDPLIVNHRVNTKSFDDDIETGMTKRPETKKSKYSKSDTEIPVSKDKEYNQYCRIVAIAILAIVGLVIGVVIGTVVGGDSNADTNEKGITPAPPIAATPTAPPLPLLPTQSPILHQDVYETLCTVLPDCSPLLEATSPQGQAFQWLTTEGMTGGGDAKVITRYALATFYYSTNGGDWVDDTQWLSTLDVCEWYTSSTNAPVCDNNGMFVVLDMQQNNVTGTLPLEIGLLTDLTVMSIRNPVENNTTILSGRLDTMFQAIPGVSLTKLTSLSLVGNQFTGGIPTEMNALTLLQTLDLSFNDLSGDIPYQLDALSNLQYVNLSNNKLTGGIPSEFFKAATNMIDLNLNGNVFTSVSESVRSLTSLSRLNIGNNELVVFPTAVMSLSNLKTLDLSNNQFGGPIPSSVGTMSNLQELSLQKNDMTGEIPSVIGNLIHLSTVLNLSENQFHGTIPVSLNQLVQLQELYLHSNWLSGPIPAELIRWSAMKSLRIDGNALTGTVPMLLCQEWSLIRSYADCREFNVSSSGDPPSSCFTFCCDSSSNPSCVCNYEATDALRCLG